MAMTPEEKARIEIRRKTRKPAKPYDPDAEIEAYINGGAVDNPPLRRFKLVLAKDIEIEPKEFLITGFLAKYETSVFYGAPDAGKSVVLLHAMCCVAAGRPLCGRQVEQAACLFVAAERGAVTRRRVLAWCKEHEVDDNDIPLAVVDDVIDLRTGKVDADGIIAAAEELAKATRMPVGWISIDTLNRALNGGDENSSKDMGSLITNADRIQRAANCHLTLTHHVPQDRTDRMRGHGSAVGAVDMTVRISKSDGVVTLEVDKANDLVEKPCLSFTFKTITLLAGENGSIVTMAPVMVEVEGEAAKPKAKGKEKKLSASATIALRAIKQALDEVGETAPASNNVPAKVRVVTTENWRRYAVKRGISGGEDRAQRAAFQRAKETLIAANQVGTWGDFHWLIRTEGK